MSNFDEVTVGNASEIGSGSHVVVLKGNLAKSAPPLNWKVTGGQVVCQESPNGPAPAVLFSNGSEGGLILGSSKDGVSIVADGPYTSMSMSKNGEKYFRFGSNGDLILGGAGSDGDIYLSTGTGHVRIALGADEMQILIQNDQNEHLVTIGGNNGDIGAKGKVSVGGDITTKGAISGSSITSNGDITAKGNITANGDITANADLKIVGTVHHQRVSERSTAISLSPDNASFMNLFPWDQPGCFIVELAASCATPLPGGNGWGGHSVYQSISVSTYGGGIASSVGPNGSILGNDDFWVTPPTLHDTAEFVTLKIPQFNSSAYPGNVELRQGTLAVRALYGSLNEF
jgi:hypothetical protein